MGCPMARHIIAAGYRVIGYAMDERADLSGMPWAEKDMTIVLAEANQVRLSLPLCGTIKEVIKGLKIRMGLGMPAVPE